MRAGECSDDFVKSGRTDAMSIAVPGGEADDTDDVG